MLLEDFLTFFIYLRRQLNSQLPYSSYVLLISVWMKLNLLSLIYFIWASLQLLLDIHHNTMQYSKIQGNPLRLTWEEALKQGNTAQEQLGIVGYSLLFSLLDRPGFVNMLEWDGAYHMVYLMVVIGRVGGNYSFFIVFILSFYICKVPEVTVSVLDNHIKFLK